MVVEGSAPLVDTASNSLGTTVTRAQLDEIPLAGRNFASLANLAPGVTGVGGGGINAGGQLSRNNSVIVDGASNDEQAVAGERGSFSLESVREYGHDQYTFLYDNEFGPPWKNPDLWIRFSYPFFQADKIRTPTLFMGGEEDFNVPILGSEQMYQALKTLNVPTQLVVYPGQNHGLTRISFVRDRYERYLAWYDKYVKGRATTTSAGHAGARP